MSEDETLETLRLGDSFLPIGSYAVSYGLEQFIQSGRVTTSEDLESLLETHIRQLLGLADLVALQAAHDAARNRDVRGIRDADLRLTGVTMAAEFRESSQSEGDRLLSLQLDLEPCDLIRTYAEQVDAGAVPGNYPVVLGVVTALEGIDDRTACQICCHGFVTGLLGAAQRLMSLGHTDAQRIHRNLQSPIGEVIEASETRSLDRMAPFAPLIDVMAADHERAERRLFVS